MSTPTPNYKSYTDASATITVVESLFCRGPKIKSLSIGVNVPSIQHLCVIVVLDLNKAEVSNAFIAWRPTPQTPDVIVLDVDTVKYHRYQGLEGSQVTIECEFKDLVSYVDTDLAVRIDNLMPQLERMVLAAVRLDSGEYNSEQSPTQVDTTPVLTGGDIKGSKPMTSIAELELAVPKLTPDSKVVEEEYEEDTLSDVTNLDFDELELQEGQEGEIDYEADDDHIVDREAELELARSNPPVTAYEDDFELESTDSLIPTNSPVTASKPTQSTKPNLIQTDDDDFEEVPITKPPVQSPSNVSQVSAHQPTTDPKKATVKLRVPKQFQNLAKLPLKGLIETAIQSGIDHRLAVETAKDHGKAGLVSLLVERLSHD